ncbi:MAG: IS66 family transposase [Candidatus Thermoplasmatota archaeon]|nr:IS66 family transposase [Candidatus Thermoplasmatota archaeon]
MDGMQKWPEEVIQAIKQLHQENKELRKENKELKEKITKLEKRLRVYENPHTPSSQQRFKGGFKGNIPRGKRGAPNGHRGATRKTSEPDELVSVAMDTCPFCGGNPGASQEVETALIEEIPPPRKIKVIQYEFHSYECPNCGLRFTTQHKDYPSEGVFGVNLLTYITMLRFHLRGVLRRIQDFLQHLCGFEISVKGIHDVLLRVGNACKNEYVRLVQCVRNARWRHIDETCSSVNGKNWWLWSFRTDSDESLVVIRDSRGRKVLEEILGENCLGGNVTDGWKAYWNLNDIQRCWAHLIREVDSNKHVSEEGKKLCLEIHRRFRLLKEFLGKDPPMDERRGMKEKWDRELVDLVDRYEDALHTKHLVTYLKNGLGCWHTCLLYPGMEPTNNLGEQAIREHVIIRKIIGAFRSVEGSENYQYIASLFATWRLQGKNIFEELENLLRKELCVS